MRIIAILTISLWFIACGHSHLLVVQCECRTAGDQPIPEIRLVQDTLETYDTPGQATKVSFHFQWDAPLQEGRFVLVEIHDTRYLLPEEPQHYLIAFPDDSFRSDHMQLYLSHRSAYVIKILEATERADLPLPSHVDSLAYTKNTDVVSPPGRGLSKRVLLLKEHPFKPYKVGSPSVLRFEDEAQPLQ